MSDATKRALSEAVSDRRPPLSVGVRPIVGGGVLEVDAQLARDLAEKRRLSDERRDFVWAETPGSQPAQAEAAALVARARDALDLAPAPPTPEDAPPLLAAALGVQEDLLLMERAEDGWRLTAGSLSFPSSWSLRAKLGRPLAEIHEHVPDYAAETRNAVVLTRMFDALRPDAPVERFGWSLYPDGGLSKFVGAEERAFARGGKSDPAAILATPHLRAERQTLSKLPRTGAILFTVRIHVRPLSPGALSAATARRLREMKPEQLAYKNLTEVCAALAAKLSEDGSANATG